MLSGSLGNVRCALTYKTKSTPDVHTEPIHLRNIRIQKAGTEGSGGLAQKLALSHVPKKKLWVCTWPNIDLFSQLSLAAFGPQELLIQHLNQVSHAAVTFVVSHMN